MRLSSLVLFIVLSFGGIVSAAICPRGDLTGDCRVSWEDLIVFAGMWLDTDECEGDLACANFDGQGAVDLSDFAVLASHWLEGVPLVINEFMASLNSSSGITDPQGHYDD